MRKWLILSVVFHLILLVVAIWQLPAFERKEIAEDAIDIEIVGHERPGIVRDLTQALKNLGANIEEFSSGVESAAFTGAEMFRANIRVALPDTLSLGDLKGALEKLAGEIMVDLTLGDE